MAFVIYYAGIKRRKDHIGLWGLVVAWLEKVLIPVWGKIHKRLAKHPMKHRTLEGWHFNPLFCPEGEKIFSN